MSVAASLFASIAPRIFHFIPRGWEWIFFVELFETVKSNPPACHLGAIRCGTEATRDFF